MSQVNRLPQGGRIDRTKPLRFTFDGKQLQRLSRRHPGLGAARQRRRAGRPQLQVSPPARHPDAPARKSRTRWSSSAGGAATEPNLRATQVELYDGLIADSQNCWPSAGASISARSTACCPSLFPSGFYYKTFMWPTSFWMKYEHFIRRMAGLGRRPTEPDPDRYDKTLRPLRCAGGRRRARGSGGGARRRPQPARASSCATSSRSSAARCCSDRQTTIDGKPAADWVADALAELRAMPDVTLLPRTVAFGYYDHNCVSLMERVTDHLVRPAEPRASRASACGACAPRRSILATGAIERPLVFVDNDRPGMHAGLGRADLSSTAMASAPGKRARGHDQQRQRLSGGARPGRCRRLRRRDRRSCARIPRASWSPSARRANIEILAGHAITARQGQAGACSEVEVARLTSDGKGVTGDGRADLVRPGPASPAAGSRPCICSRSRAASCAGTRTSLAFVPDKLLPGQKQPLGRRRARQVRARRLPGRRPRRRRGRRARRRLHASPAGTRAESPAPSRRRARMRPMWVVPSEQAGRPRRQAFRRLPERRDRRRRAAGASRRLSLGRASEALHHHGHGDRPGQDQQRQRAGPDGASCAASASRRSAPRPSARPTRR